MLVTIDALKRALFRASIVTSNSTRLSFAGWEVEQIMNTSSPLIFSLISTKTSSSAKRLIAAFARGILIYSATSLANGILPVSYTHLRAHET